MTPAALPKEAQAPQVSRMEGTAGWSMWAGVLRGPLVIAVLFAIVLAVGSSFDIYVAGSVAIYGLAAAGPICGRVLADLGAEVVRVENPDGEHSRQVGLTFAANNRNKASLGLDLTKPEGLDVLARITEQSDVVLTNALPEASARLGIDYATVAARNPATCHISILGFGRRPPFGGRRVVDAAAQALSGQALAEGGGLELGCTGGFLDNGRDDAEVLRRYGLDGQRDALVASGAMRGEPGQSTLQASSV